MYELSVVIQKSDLSENVHFEQSKITKTKFIETRKDNPSLS